MEQSNLEFLQILNTKYKNGFSFIQPDGSYLVMNIEKVEINDNNTGFISISADELKKFHINTKSRKRRLRRKNLKQ